MKQSRARTKNFYQDFNYIRFDSDNFEIYFPQIFCIKFKNLPKKVYDKSFIISSFSDVLVEFAFDILPWKEWPPQILQTVLEVRLELPIKKKIIFNFINWLKYFQVGYFDEKFKLILYPPSSKIHNLPRAWGGNLKQRVPITSKSSKFKGETQYYVVKLPKSAGARHYCPKIWRMPGTLGTRANSSPEWCSFPMYDALSLCTI